MQRTGTLLALALLLSLPASPAADLVGGSLSLGDGSEIRDLAARKDGKILATGTIGDGAAVPQAGQVHELLSGDHTSGARAFVLQFPEDLSTIDWVALFPGGCLIPNRIAVGDDGAVAVGGKHLGGLAAQDQGGRNWKGRDGALVKLAADGSQCDWFAPVGPNQGEVSGLDIDARGRVYFTAGSKQRQAANYLLRKNGETGENEPWADDAWCVYLHTNQEPLKAEGQFLAFYDKARQQSEEGFGYDYDGRDAGWGPVGFSLKGFRIGGQVLALPDGDVVVSSCLQYDFRVNKRTPEGLKKGKGFPAFDYFLARYSDQGELRWSTNLYQAGDSVHTPDQKPIDLSYDSRSDSIYVLAKQHGSNVYRFKGDLDGDTGNLMISWLGKVDGKSGSLQQGWYFQNNRSGKFAANGRPQSPPYPKLAGNALQRVAVGGDGRVYLTGSGGAKVWTSEQAFQPWPADQSGGGQGVLVRLKPDLEEVDFSSCLFADTEGGFSPRGLVVTDKAVVVAGAGVFGGELAARVESPAWSAGGGGRGCLVFAIVK